MRKREKRERKGVGKKKVRASELESVVFFLDSMPPPQRRRRSHKKTKLVRGPPLVFLPVHFSCPLSRAKYSRERPPSSPSSSKEEENSQSKKREREERSNLFAQLKVQPPPLFNKYQNSSSCPHSTSSTSRPRATPSLRRTVWTPSAGRRRRCRSLSRTWTGLAR